MNLTEEYTNDLDLFDPMIDFTFKNLFGSDNPKSHELRIGLLNDTLGLNIIEAKIVNSELAVESNNEKRGVVDLHCILDNGNHVIVEIQQQNQYNSIERCIYYLANVLAKQDLRGKDYKELQPVYCLLVSDFKVTKCKDVKNSIKLHIEKDNEAIDLINLITLELPKIKEIEDYRTEKLSNEEKWAYWFSEANNEKNSLIKNITNEGGTIKMAQEELKRISKDLQMRANYLVSVDSAALLKSQLNYARDEGEAKGYEKGEAKGITKEQATIMFKLLKTGDYTMDQINEIIEPSDESIKLLRQMIKESNYEFEKQQMVEENNYEIKIINLDDNDNDNNEIEQSIQNNNDISM